ncbi:Uncharacterized protein Fot_06063 [Forsythia ovata]|uniref:Uncharacterized protein n=1 Tax=Forsythia ovata TaxID=205694 RepID=A0ABD1WS04_9LAMI
MTIDTPNRSLTKSKKASPKVESMLESNTSSHQRIKFSTPKNFHKTKETTKIKACKTETRTKSKKNLKREKYIQQTLTIDESQKITVTGKFYLAKKKVELISLGQPKKNNNKESAKGEDHGKEDKNTKNKNEREKMQDNKVMLITKLPLFSLGGFTMPTADKFKKILRELLFTGPSNKNTKLMPEFSYR